MELLLVVILALAVFCGGTSSILIPNRVHGHGGITGDYDWDYLLFVQQWPASVCVDGHITNSQTCAIPSELSSTDWTIHGIWPTKYNTTGPEDCNKTATFSLDPLQPIMDDLKMYWPNLETGEPVDSFWKHEWLKHGTCAQNLPTLQGEFNFFNQALVFRKQFNLYHALFGQNIAPSADKIFSHDEITDALQKAFGERIEVFCAYSTDTKDHYVAEIRFCLTKDFSLMECPSSPGVMAHETSSCPKSAQLHYPPIQPSRPKAGEQKPNRRRDRKQRQ